MPVATPEWKLTPGAFTPLWTVEVNEGMCTILLGDYTGAWVRPLILVFEGPLFAVGFETSVVPVGGPLTAVTKVVKAGVSPDILVDLYVKLTLSTTAFLDSSLLLSSVPTV